MTASKSKNNKFVYQEDDTLTIRDKDGKVISGKPKKDEKPKSKKDEKPKSKKASGGFTQDQRRALIRLANALPAGDSRRRVILAELVSED